ncbi:hypothetical protein PM082_000415 [Marasmius tenuissimus]|nr:hypothetical protein PM082_000415 [Marasmius tenuissimus]
MQQVLSHPTIDSAPIQYPPESLSNECSDAPPNPSADAEGSWDHDCIAQLLDGVFPPSDIEMILSDMAAGNSTSSPSASSSHDFHTLLTDNLDIPFVSSESSPQPSDSGLTERKERSTSAKVKAATMTASQRKKTTVPAPKRVKAKVTGTGSTGMRGEKGENMGTLRRVLVEDSDFSCFSDGSTHGDDSDYAPSSSRPSPPRTVARKRKERATSSTSVSPSSDLSVQTQWVGDEMEYSSPSKPGTKTMLSVPGIGNSSASRKGSTSRSSLPPARSPASVAKKKISPKSDHPYGCPLSTPDKPCYQRFTRPGDARRHARTAKVHSEKMFWCELCDESYGREYSLERHIRTSDKHARKAQELEQLAESSED